MSILSSLSTFLLTISPSQIPGGWSVDSSTYGPYVPWDTGIFARGVAILRNNMGSGINIAFWIFLLVSGIYVVIKIVNSIGG